MTMFKALGPLYLTAGIGLCVHAMMTMDVTNFVYGAGLFVLAMVMVAALIWCPFEDDAEL